MTTIQVPENSLILMVGASGAGKSTWANKHFGEFAVVSSDRCRAMISDDPTNQEVTAAAFKLLHQIVRERLANKRIVVVDATNVKPSSRQEFFALAREFRAPLIAVVINPPLEVVKRQNLSRKHVVPEAVVERHFAQLTQTLVEIVKEPFDHVYTVDGSESVDIVSNKHDYVELASLDGFDVVGDNTPYTVSAGLI